MQTNDISNTPALWQSYQQVPFDKTYRVGLQVLLKEIQPKPTEMRIRKPTSTLSSQSRPDQAVKTRKTTLFHLPEIISWVSRIKTASLWDRITLVLVVILVVALINSSIYLPYKQNQRFAEIKTEIGQKLGLADAAGDEEAQAIAYYNAVITLAVEAETIRPGDPEVVRLRQQALSELDRLGDITRLMARPYHTFEETVQLTAVVLQEGFNGGLYTLDESNGQVFYHRTSEDYLTAIAEPEIIVSTGKLVLNHTVSSITDITWRPLGMQVARDGLAMLDKAGLVLVLVQRQMDTGPQKRENFIVEEPPHFPAKIADVVGEPPPVFFPVL
jgi:hypothetical protein